MPGQHEVALAVPVLEPVVVALRQRPRADERHLAAQHVEQLRQLVEREAAQEAADRRHARVVADLEQRAVGLVVLLELVLAAASASRVHRAELEAGERRAADARAHRAVEHRAARGELDRERAIASSSGRQDEQQQRRADDVERALERRSRRPRRPAACSSNSGTDWPGHELGAVDRGSPSSTARSARARRAGGSGRRARPPRSCGKSGSAMMTSSTRCASSTLGRSSSGPSERRPLSGRGVERDEADDLDRRAGARRERVRDGLDVLAGADEHRAALVAGRAQQRRR